MRGLIGAIRSDLGLSPEGLAAVLGCSVETVARWDEGVEEIPESVRDRISDLLDPRSTWHQLVVDQRARRELRPVRSALVGGVTAILTVAVVSLMTSAGGGLAEIGAIGLAIIGLGLVYSMLRTNARRCSACGLPVRSEDATCSGCGARFSSDVITWPIIR